MRRLLSNLPESLFNLLKWTRFLFFPLTFSGGDDIVSCCVAVLDEWVSDGFVKISIKSRAEASVWRGTLAPKHRSLKSGSMNLCALGGISLDFVWSLNYPGWLCCSRTVYVKQKEEEKNSWQQHHHHHHSTCPTNGTDWRSCKSTHSLCTKPPLQLVWMKAEWAKALTDTVYY